MRMSGLTREAGAVSPFLPNATKTAEKQPGESGGDALDLSRAGRGLAEFSSSPWSPNAYTGFTMSAYTSHGTSVTLESHTQRFTMGKFAKTDSPFQMRTPRGGPDLDITFTSADGRTQTYKVTENMRFVESEDGEVTPDDGRASSKVHPDDKDMNIIAVNLSDGATAEGGTGDDILFNLGRGAALDGGDGDDTLISMGDKARLLGGAGDDTLKVVRDVLRKEDVGRGIDFPSSTLNLHKAAVRGFEEGLSVLMNGGDGDDTLESDTKLRDSTILGGDGSDTFRFDKLVGSKLDAGAGDDAVNVQSMSGTILNGGDGDDRLNVHTVSHGSMVDGGKGNDVISVHTLEGKSAVRGGDGDDDISVTYSTDSAVDGGDGNDRIFVYKAEGSVIGGGRGDDTIHVDFSSGSIIDGGDGDDDIYVADASDSLISGGRGNDTLFVRNGSRNLADGGDGDNSVTARGSALITDNGRILSNNISPDDMSSALATINGVINHLPLDNEARVRYRAILSYASQAMRTGESAAF